MAVRTLSLMNDRFATSDTASGDRVNFRDVRVSAALVVSGGIRGDERRALPTFRAESLATPPYSATRERATNAVQCLPTIDRNRDLLYLSFRLAASLRRVGQRRLGLCST
jgi:hypothetical protein